MKPSNKTDKLSHLIRVGSIVHTVDGGVYRCTSKLANGGEVYVRLANLQGKPVSTPADLRPISPALARFAAFMRLAYNPDFDLYVKEYIKAAGLPVDPTMNWSKFFQARFAPKLISKDPEVQDEAIHQIIIQTLVVRHVLSNFQESITKFPEHIQNLPLERQVSTFLMQTFNWRVAEANRYIEEYIFQKDTNSMWSEGEDEDEDVNLLDTEENANSTSHELAEADLAVAEFRKGFAEFLNDKFQKKAIRYKEENKDAEGNPVPWVVYYKNSGAVVSAHATKEDAEATVNQSNTANYYLSIFDLLYQHLREGDMPRGVDLYEEWKDGPGENKTHAWFKVLFANLPKLIDSYISKFLDEKYLNPFIEVMRQVGKGRRKEQELEPIMSGLKLADEFPINHNIEPDAPSSGSDMGSGGSMNIMPSIGGEAEGAVGEIAEAAPLLAVASKKDLKPGEQMDGDVKKKRCWSCGAFLVKGKCPVDAKTCGRSKKVATSAYEDGYKNGHADKYIGTPFLEVNKHPGASDYSRQYCQGYYDGYHDRPFKNIYAAAQWEVPKCKGCGTAQEVRDCPACKEKYCNDCILTHHANNPSHDRVASKQGAYHYINGKQHKVGGCSICKKAEMDAEDRGFREMDTALDMKNIIEDVIGSGLFNSEGEAYFDWSGCDYCHTGDGATVSDYRGYRNLEDAQAQNREEREYEFRLCGDCLNKLYYGTE